MKKLINRNLFLIKKKIYIYIFFLLTIMVMLFLKKDAFSFLVFFITAMTLISVSAIEEYDASNYKTTFSMPIIRDEFAKVKALTFLLIFGGIALIKRDKGLFPYAIVFIILFDNMKIPSLVIGNNILIYLVSTIFLVVGRTVYVIAKIENLITKHTIYFLVCQ